MITMMVIIMMVVTAAVQEVDAVKDVSDDEYLKFPRLYHLDDYEECLRRPDGVFCLGSFHIAPPPPSLYHYHPTYQLMKQYSENSFACNRTRVHRGYCLTTRCSPVQGAGAGEDAPAARFEKCVARWGTRRGLHLYLESLTYCRTHQQFAEQSQWRLGERHRSLLTFVAVVVGLNILGTLVEVFGGKWKPLVAWSTATNVVRLFKPGEDRAPRSTLTLEGGKVLILWYVIFVNVGATHTKLYLHNPRFIEQVFHHPILQYLLNTNIALQVVVMVSSFLLAETMLLERRRPTLGLVFTLLLRQIIRMWPVHVFSLWYASTWWPLARGGPQWHHVEAEAAICMEQFWASAFFVDNFTGEHSQCLLTWSISVYMQIYTLGAILTWIIMRTRRPLAVLTSLTAITVVVTAAVAYVRDWKPFVAFGGPETIQSSYAKERTHLEWYTKPWGSLAACLLGLTLAFLQKTLMYRKLNMSECKWFTPASQLAVPIVLAWAGVGRVVSTKLGRAARAFWFALDEPFVCLAVAMLLTQVCHITKKKKPSSSQKQGFLCSFFSWWMWYPLSRVSLAMVSLHRVIHSIIAFSRPALYNACVVDWIVDFVGTASYAYLSAATVTLLLDMPIQRLFDYMPEKI